MKKLFLILVLTLVAVSHSVGAHEFRPFVPFVQSSVQPYIDRHLSQRQESLLQRLDRARLSDGAFKLPVMDFLHRPWDGIVQLEEYGLSMVEAATDAKADIAKIVTILSASVGRPSSRMEPLATTSHGVENKIAHILRTYDQARSLRDQAIQLTEKEIEWMYSWVPSMLEHFSIQVTFNEQTEAFIRNDYRFLDNLATKVDWGLLTQATELLLQLSDKDFLRGLETALTPTDAVNASIPGVTGQILYATETVHGWIIVGGASDNTYDLNQFPAALIIDFGGNNIYNGPIAAANSPTLPLSMIIDLDGDDTYNGTELGLATGILGVGILIDFDGDDTYTMSRGAGATGFGGIGILYDHSGSDTYIGSTFTQGAAIGGIGLLVDGGGNDRFSADLYGIGFAGPAAAGAVINVSGDNHYQIGGKYPSGYNVLDVPSGDPNHPRYQYAAFGMGMGTGRRFFPWPTREEAKYQLAGGIGFLIDIAGDDKYESSNWSQGSGYFFGVGVKLDLAGDDYHAAARYGMAAGAHQGMGLFIDYAGNDIYTSTGPTYNCGTSWDLSVFLFIDGGGDDAYNLRRSEGPAIAMHSSWAVFASLGGNDSFDTRRGLGYASNNSLSVYYNAGGTNNYERAPTSIFGQQPGNKTVLVDQEGGLFIDLW